MLLRIPPVVFTGFLLFGILLVVSTSFLLRIIRSVVSIFLQFVSELLFAFFARVKFFEKFVELFVNQ